MELWWFWYSLAEIMCLIWYILTNASFAFTHTCVYTLVKLNQILFFPKRAWKILKNAQTVVKKKLGRGWDGGAGVGGEGGYNSSLWQRCRPIRFKTSALKDNCPFKLLLGKRFFPRDILHSMEFSNCLPEKIEFLWFFSTVCFQLCLQPDFMRGCKFTLISDHICFYVSPLCIFKCALKLDGRKDA